MNLTATAVEQALIAVRPWVTPQTLMVLRAEIDNEAHGGVSPATLSSVVDSVMQGLLSQMFEDVNVEADVLTALLVARDRLPGDTRIVDLLDDLDS